VRQLLIIFIKEYLETDSQNITNSSQSSNTNQTSDSISSSSRVKATTQPDEPEVHVTIDKASLQRIKPIDLKIHLLLRFKSNVYFLGNSNKAESELVISHKDTSLVDCWKSVHGDDYCSKLPEDQQSSQSSSNSSSTSSSFEIDDSNIDEDRNNENEMKSKIEFIHTAYSLGNEIGKTKSKVKQYYPIESRNDFTMKKIADIVEIYLFNF